jgi:hypothetical protein
MGMWVLLSTTHAHNVSMATGTPYFPPGQMLQMIKAYSIFKNRFFFLRTYYSTYITIHQPMLRRRAITGDIFQEKCVLWRGKCGTLTFCTVQIRNVWHYNTETMSCTICIHKQNTSPSTLYELFYQRKPVKVLQVPVTREFPCTMMNVILWFRASALMNLGHQWSTISLKLRARLLEYTRE